MEITRDQMLAGMVTCPGIQSATWPRKTDKIVNRCPDCNREAAKIRKNWVCHTVNCRSYGEVVNVWRDKVASKGDPVTLQFRVPLNGEGTKNWQPAGGFPFMAATRAEADIIKRKGKLLQVCKMSETGTQDLRATPRFVAIDLVESWKAEGVEYEIVE